MLADIFVFPLITKISVKGYSAIMPSSLGLKQNDKKH